MEEKYPYTRNTEQLHTLAGLEPLNVTLQERGLHTKEILLNGIKDNNYKESITYANNKEHGWFKKPILKINQGKPHPIFTI